MYITLSIYNLRKTYLEIHTDKISINLATYNI